MTTTLNWRTFHHTGGANTPHSAHVEQAALDDGSTVFRTYSNEEPATPQLEIHLANGGELSSDQPADHAAITELLGERWQADLNTWGRNTERALSAASHPPHITTGPSGYRPEVDPHDHHDFPGAQLRCLREALGITNRELADVLGVNLRTVQRWEARTAPAWVATEMDYFNGQTTIWLDKLEQLDATVVFHAGWHATITGQLLPASWWRAVVGHAARHNPSLAVAWGD